MSDPKNAPPKPPLTGKDDPRLLPNWDRACENCGQEPTVGKSKLCGPCFFGEADTANDNW